MQISRYRILTRRAESRTFAVVADLHDRPWRILWSLLEKERPDAILIPGDLTEQLGDSPGDPPGSEAREGLAFLEEAVRLAPTFYSLGNHEIGASHMHLWCSRRKDGKSAEPSDRQGEIHSEYLEKIRATGAILLRDEYITYGDVTIGGLGSGLLARDRKPNLEWLENFEKTKGFKLLLCHHPEYFDRYLRRHPIDLIVSGHAHGGQWRILGRGVYAPDQHLFPRYTSGIHEGRLVISRGVANSVPWIPRFFNPCELVMIDLVNEDVASTEKKK